jgi:putative membrane protein
MRKQFRCVLASTAALLLASTVATAQDDRDRPRPTSPGGAGDQTTEPRRPAGDPTGAREPQQPVGDPADRARAQEASRDQGKEEKFVREAAIDAEGQAELSRLAAQKASNPEVKQFAQRVAEDQGKASDQLKALAAQKNITVPAELEGKHKKALDRLSKLSAAEFDRTYMRRMLDDHKDGVSDFRKAASSARDNDVKMFAAQTLPTLEEHLRLAQQFDQANRETRGTTGALPSDPARPGSDPLGRPDSGRGQPDPSGRPGGQPDPSGRPGAPGNPGPGQDPGGNR